MIKDINVNQTKVEKILEDFKKNPNWIPGFVAGEKCMTAYQNKQPRWQFPYQIQAAFIVVQHRRHIEILYRLKQYFGCGQVSKNKEKNDTKSDVWQWRLRDVHHQCNIIIPLLRKVLRPFFEKHKLLTTKHEEFIIFKDLCFFLQSQYHLKSDRNYEHCLNLAKSIVKLCKESKLLNNEFSSPVQSTEAVKCY